MIDYIFLFLNFSPTSKKAQICSAPPYYTSLYSACVVHVRCVVWCMYGAKYKHCTVLFSSLHIPWQQVPAICPGIPRISKNRGIPWIFPLFVPWERSGILAGNHCFVFFTTSTPIQKRKILALNLSQRDRSFKPIKSDSERFFSVTDNIINSQEFAGTIWGTRSCLNCRNFPIPWEFPGNSLGIPWEFLWNSPGIWNKGQRLFW